MRCEWCDQEMTEAASCKDVDLSVVAPGCEGNRCGDCGVVAGGVHHPGCDVERCSACGGQAIACDCKDHDGRKSRWAGEFPGVAEARKAGFFCRDFHPDGRVATPEDPITGDEILDQWNGRPIQWHVPCGPDDPGAHPDLNRWAMHVSARRKP